MVASSSKLQLQPRLFYRRQDWGGTPVTGRVSSRARDGRFIITVGCSLPEVNCCTGVDILVLVVDDIRTLGVSLRTVDEVHNDGPE